MTTSISADLPDAGLWLSHQMPKGTSARQVRLRLRTELTHRIFPVEKGTQKITENRARTLQPDPLGADSLLHSVALTRAKRQDSHRNQSQHSVRPRKQLPHAKKPQ